MVRRKPRDPKSEALRKQGSLNPHPEGIRDPLFAEEVFFDPRDLVQVKYEMVRRVRVDRQPVSRSADAFGFSRPSFYKAQAALDGGGLPALVPKRPGPRRAHKLDDEVLDFLERALAKEGALPSVELARRVEKRFGRSVHPRSVERALKRRGKKRQ